MYSLTEKQIDYISDDINARGITLESLRMDILDHVCCILEAEFDGEENFEIFYKRVIAGFYKTELVEIEKETILNLKFKNYYIMKKLMIGSGTFSVFTFIFGSFFKVMHWPGANVLLASAILSAALIFLPLVFIFKSKQENTLRDKIEIGVGSLTMILFSMGVLFRIEHWPGSLIMWFTAIALSFLVFIPLYFFNGIRKPETKVNTIVFTILMVLATGIQFAMINVNPASKQTQLRMYSYLQSEEIISKMKSNSSVQSDPIKMNLIGNCEQIKKLIIENAIGVPVIPADFETKDILMEDGNLGNEFFAGNPGANLVLQLRKDIEGFNSKVEPSKRIPVTNFVFEVPEEKLHRYSASLILSSLSQIEMCALLAN